MNARSIDVTLQYAIYGKIDVDASLWDKVTAQITAPVSGTIYVYGTSDGGDVQGVNYGSANLARNFMPIQATNLATGTAVSSFNAAGEYQVDVNTKYIRFGGGGTSVYQFILNYQRIY